LWSIFHKIECGEKKFGSKTDVLITSEVAVNFGAGYSDHRHRWQLLLTSNLFRHGFSKTHMMLLYSKWFPTAVTLSFRPHDSVTTMQQSPF
jgi:hypothetical protein